MNPHLLNLKVSVITVCLNSAEYLERAICSVLSQTYKNIEHVIIDGGSTDNTLNIIRKYENCISYWVSESDSGIYDAMNKGIKQATGDIIYLLNSDDRFYDAKVIERVVDSFNRNRVDFIYGDILSEYIEKPGFSLGKYPSFITRLYLTRRTIAHQATFIYRRCFKEVGYFDTRYKILSDYEWLLRALYKNRLRYKHIKQIISVFQCGGISTNKDNRTQIMLEEESIQRIYFTPFELHIAKWLNFFIYADFLRVIARIILRKKGYQLLVGYKNKLFNEFSPSNEES